MELSLGLAFLGGLLSFFSPCVLPLVPAYIGYLGGRAIHVDETTTPGYRRWNTFTHGVAFILGFSIVFILLGLAFSFLGSILQAIQEPLAKIGGLVVILFGIHMTGIYRIPFLEYELRLQNKNGRNLGYLSSLMMGIFFSAGWSPCLGPVLAAILTVAMNTGDTTQGTLLLSFYALGMAIPFLIAAAGISWVVAFIKKFSKSMRIIEIVMGVVLIIVGIMLITGTFGLISQYGNFLDVGL